MEIQVQEIEAAVFQVTVSEGESKSRHRVTVPDDLYQRLTDGDISQAECVEAAFRFLLDREPKESILAQFDLRQLRCRQLGQLRQLTERHVLP